MIKMRNQKNKTQNKEWVKPVLETLKFEDTKGSKQWVGASVEGATTKQFIHESTGNGFFHRNALPGASGNESDTRTAAASSSGFYARDTSGPS